MIALSINVLLLDKKRFKEVTLKNGKKAVFCELIMFESKDRKFDNDYFVKQQCTKEEREARLEMPILGNGKILGGNKGQAAPKTDGPPPDDSDSPPF